MDVIRAHKARQARERLRAGSRWTGPIGDEGFLFASLVGAPLQARNVMADYHRDLTGAGLPSRTFHSLRHTAATLLLDGGEELATVSKLLGHSTLSTTSDYYAHLTHTISRRAADRLRGILAG